MDYVEIKLANGDVETVRGTLAEVEKKLSDAAKSAASLAWFTSHADEESVGVSAGHVVSVRAGGASD